MLLKISEKIIRIYQRIFSYKKSCKFYPVCSEYFLLSIKKYGFIKGVLKSFKRVLRCNPFSNGGIDFP